jgi:hypothetical protein
MTKDQSSGGALMGPMVKWVWGPTSTAGLGSHVTNCPLGQPLLSPHQWHSGACTRRRQERRILHPPGSQTPTCQCWDHGCQHFVICHNSVALALPAAQTPEPGTRCRASPDAPSCPQGSYGLGSAWARESSLEDGSGLGIHSPSPATSYPAVGEGTASLLSRPHLSAESGVHPHSQHPLKAREEVPIHPAGASASGSPPSWAHTQPCQWLPLPSAIWPLAREERRWRGRAFMQASWTWQTLTSSLSVPPCLTSANGTPPLMHICMGCCHFGKVGAQLTAKASGSRCPVDAMTKRSWRVKTLPLVEAGAVGAKGPKEMVMSNSHLILHMVWELVIVWTEFSTGVPHFKQTSPTYRLTMLIIHFTTEKMHKDSWNKQNILHLIVWNI